MVAAHTPSCPLRPRKPSSVRAGSVRIPGARCRDSAGLDALKVDGCEIDGAEPGRVRGVRPRRGTPTAASPRRSLRTRRRAHGDRRRPELGVGALEPARRRRQQCRLSLSSRSDGDQGDGNTPDPARPQHCERVRRMFPGLVCGPVAGWSFIDRPTITRVWDAGQRCSIVTESIHQDVAVINTRFLALVSDVWVEMTSV